VKKICITLVLVLILIPICAAVTIEDYLKNPTQENLDAINRRLESSASQLSKPVLDWAMWVFEFVLDLI